MTYSIIENHSDKAGAANSLSRGSESEDQIATFVDYLKQPAFQSNLDYIVSVSSDVMPFGHTEFADFADEHLNYGDWEDQRCSLMELAGYMVHSGNDLFRIIDNAPEYAVPLSLAVEHAAAIEAAEAAKENGIREVENKIGDFWEYEEEQSRNGASRYGLSFCYLVKDGVLTVEHRGREKSVDVGDADPESLAAQLFLELKAG